MTNQCKLIKKLSDIITSRIDRPFHTYSEITEELERMLQARNYKDELEKFLMFGDEDYSEFCSTMALFMETKDRHYENVLSDLFPNSDLKCELTKLLMNPGKNNNIDDDENNNLAVCLASACLRKFSIEILLLMINVSEMLSDKYDDNEIEYAA